MKTIKQALIDEIIYPIPEGKIENKIIARNLNGDDEYTSETARSKDYRGAYADCLTALIQSVNFTEGDKSVSSLSEESKKQIIKRANSIYKSIGEESPFEESEPMVYIE